jgi:glucose-6-phosphate-specific signal transduction histidine kinase
LLYRINKKISEELAVRKNEGKDLVTEEEIDQLIDRLLNDDLGKNDKTD